ncbi:MAG: sigma-54 dependent transcriptional regulator [Candidatus Rokubacteria bacterium]|nr:sigma-54 dependent transcriptional regulator [Candidatus Rokubacteria bacterium]
MKARVLVVDDDDGSRTGLAELLEGMGHDVEQSHDGREALERARESRPHVVIADLVMPGLDGLGLLRALREDLPSTAVIVLTGHATVETAVSAIREGAYDYLTKPLDIQRVRVLVERALEQGKVLREVTLLRRQLRQGPGVGTLLGESPAMQEVFNQIELAAPTSAPVLILGESGVGKELVARTIHQLSPRSAEPFIAVNCSAVPETLLESELLGHEKGAFTGAVERRAGFFELADRGTILLDEIAEMTSSLQAKYLRVLQDGVIRRVGGRTNIHVDVRVLAATNKDPMRALRDGTFREDLYYRLNVFTIRIPPLRQRKDDIPVLAGAFVKEFNVRYEREVHGLDESALEKLRRHSWPGNVRELRNCLERAVVACPKDVLTADLLPLDPGSDIGPAATEVVTVPLGTTVEEGERQLILRTLESVHNNKTRAAQILRISLKTLHNKLNRYAGKRLPVGREL